MNPSVAYIRSSDGSGDASLMTITQVRTAPATTITVNTVAGAPTNFFATMGTPHTFNDPVTGETITIISEATAVSFAGRIDSGKVEIVAIAPGETDLGSKVGDIIIIRPTTQWADNIHGVLSKSLNDDGTLKNKSVTLANMNGGTTAGVLVTDSSGNVTANPLPMFAGWRTTDIVAGNGVWTVIPMNIVDYDSHSAYSTSTGIYTIPVTGIYAVSGAVTVTVNQGDEVIVGNKLNGQDEAFGFRNARASAGAGDTTGSFSVTARKYNAGDKINLGIFQNTGGNKAIKGGKAMTWYSIACVALI